MPRFRLTSGTYRRADGTRAAAGTDDDIIEISEERADRLGTGYERLDDDGDGGGEATAEVVEADEPPETPDVDADTSVDPDDDEDDPPTDADTSVDVDEDEAEDETEAESDDESPVPADDPDEDVPDVEASGEVPDDYQTLSKMAKHYEGDEVHGSMTGDALAEFFGDLSDTEIAYLKDRARGEDEEA